MNKLLIVGWTAVFFQFISLIIQIETGLIRFMFFNLGLMPIALICFNIRKMKEGGRK